jgi:hypothetical protein
VNGAYFFVNLEACTEKYERIEEYVKRGSHGKRETRNYS